MTDINICQISLLNPGNASSQDIWNLDRKTFKEFYLETIDLKIDRKLPDSSYGLKIQSREETEFLKSGMIAIFSRKFSAKPALHQTIYLGIKDRSPQIVALVKSDSLEPEEVAKNESGSSLKKTRKSFMTPTPLHIPESTLSPIPFSSHQMLIYKNYPSSRTNTIPLEQVFWWHPLVFISNP